MTLPARQIVRNAKVYKRVSVAASPVSLATMRSYLKIPASQTADDTLIQSMIDAATEWQEKYTGRDFRAITWDLLLDLFTDRIELRRDPVASVTTVKHLVSGSLVTVDSSVFYLKKLVQSSEILLNEDQEWPTNTDDREQVIEIRFVTEGFQCQDSIIDAIERHVAMWYRNRGDCPDVTTSAKNAGVTMILDGFRISRV